MAAYWAWSGNAWLESEGGETNNYTDFAGSGVVHAVGGVIALVGACLVGPRKERFQGGSIEAIPGHSTPLATLGGFILFFGFLAFNGGSVFTASTTDDAVLVANAVVATVLAGAGGGLSAVVFEKLWVARGGHHSYWSLVSVINGTLTGMVAICAGADSVEPWAALVIGLIAGPVYHAWSGAVARLRIDDPVDAVAVHLGGGIWGVLAQPIFEYEQGIVYDFDKDSWDSFGWNLAGVLSLIAWAGGCALVMFGILRFIGHIRITDEAEAKGIDMAEHGAVSYHMDILPTPADSPTTRERDTIKTAMAAV